MSSTILISSKKKVSGQYFRNKFWGFDKALCVLLSSEKQTMLLQIEIILRFVSLDTNLETSFNIFVLTNVFVD